MGRIRTHNNRRRAKAEKARMTGEGFWRVGKIQVSVIRFGPSWADRGATNDEIAADIQAMIDMAVGAKL